MAVAPASAFHDLARSHREHSDPFVRRGSASVDLIKRSPSLAPEVEVAKLKATALLPNSSATAQHGIGYSDKARWEQAQTLMKDFGDLTKTRSDVSVLHTNDFAPKP